MIARKDAPAAAEAAPEAVCSDALAAEALLISRTYIYTLFHKALGGVPDRELLDELVSDTALDVVDEYAEDETMDGLAGFLRSLGERDASELLDAARDEYARVFLGPAALPALPIESPYLTHDAAVFQENTLAVRERYRAHGLLPRKYLRLPDDHVALMCGFMARLAAESLEAFKEGDASALSSQLAEQRDFALGHMADWLPAYAEGLRRSRTAVLYPQMAEALAAFLRVDAACASSMIAWLSEAGENADGLMRTGEPPVSFARAEEALARIAALHPFGIEDNELAPEGEVPGRNAAQAAFSAARG